MNDPGCMAAGAVSRWSIVVTLPPGVRMTMKPPPPMPHENGSTTPSTAAATTAASTAFAPSRSASTAACVASRSTVAAAPPAPSAVGVCSACDCAMPAAGTAREALRAAVELQRLFRAGTDDEPGLPLGVGIGIDAGEAVPVEGGYRGGALNLARDSAAALRRARFSRARPSSRSLGTSTVSGWLTAAPSESRESKSRSGSSKSCRTRSCRGSPRRDSRRCADSGEGTSPVEMGPPARSSP